MKRAFDFVLSVTAAGMLALVILVGELRRSRQRKAATG
jgi:hypothetical protein